VKRFMERGEGGKLVPSAEFHLVGDVVEIRWLVPGLELFMALDSIVIDQRELRPEDGRAFYDGLERAWPGSIESDDADEGST
jgi:hypothetical protein